MVKIMTTACTSPELMDRSILILILLSILMILFMTQSLFRQRVNDDNQKYIIYKMIEREVLISSLF